MSRGVPRVLMASVLLFLLGVHSICRAAPEQKSDAAVLDEIFGVEMIARNVRAVRRRAATQSLQERYRHLADWVLPTPDGRALRISGKFSQTGPASIAEVPPTDGTASGGRLVSPVYDLLDAARERDRLAELQKRIESLPPAASSFQQRAQAALLLLVHLEQDDDDAAFEVSDTLLKLVQSSPESTIPQMLPETLVVCRSRHRGHSALTDLLALLNTRVPNFRRLPDSPWQTHLTSEARMVRYLEKGDVPGSEGLVGRLDQWHPGGTVSMYSRGTGHPEASWSWNGEELRHIAGHHFEYVLFASPLRGNYEVEADLAAHGMTQFLMAGRIVGMRADGRGIDFGTVQARTAARPIDPPLEAGDAWVRYRGVVRDRVFTVFLNGREVHSEAIPEAFDPWVGPYCAARYAAVVRDVQITGQPVVPDAVTLSEHRDLIGWTSYQHESFDRRRAAWNWEQDEQGIGVIVGRAESRLAGRHIESLLQYQRPLREDGSITYDFFYQDGTVEAHPALDRLVFLVQPEGIRLHWMTDGYFDPTDITSDNLVNVPHERRGPDRLPLLPNSWNQMRLVVAGQAVTLQLNGHTVYERELTVENRRTFGLFRDRSRSLRVKNVVLRGDWPKHVPPVAEQELTSPVTRSLHQQVADFGEALEHDFVKDGLPPRLFELDQDRRSAAATPEGVVHADQSQDSEWTSAPIPSRLRLHGDFDLMLGFEGAELPAVNSSCGLALFAGTDHLEVIRRRLAPGTHRVMTTFATSLPDGNFRHDGDHLTTEALSGTFRVVRRGDTISTFFADGDSTVFRQIAEQTWPGCGKIPATFDLTVLAHNHGRAQVTWKTLHVAASEVTFRASR